MPDYCPQCDALQALSHTLDEARGYARPLTDGDRRNQARYIPKTAAQVEMEEHVGHILVTYTCTECGFRVVPGETHVRNWTRPDHWLPVDYPQRRGRKKRTKTTKEGRDDAARNLARRKEGAAAEYNEKRRKLRSEIDAIEALFRKREQK